MTVGGWRNEGMAGQAQVINKGSMGQEVKTIYFAHNPKVEQTLTTYLEQARPLHDPHGRKRLGDMDNHEALFITERGTPYSMKAFYFHWYKHYERLRNLCPVLFSPHDIRHLFITEYLIRLKLACQVGTDQFDEEGYLQAREAFGSLVMGWRSINTINIYDHSRDGEKSLSVLADYQKDLSQRHYVSVPPPFMEPQSIQEHVSPRTHEESNSNQHADTVWTHDRETLAWIKKLQQQKDQHEQRGRGI